MVKPCRDGYIGVFVHKFRLYQIVGVFSCQLPEQCATHTHTYTIYFRYFMAGMSGSLNVACVQQGR